MIKEKDVTIFVFAKVPGNLAQMLTAPVILVLQLILQMLIQV